MYGSARLLVVLALAACLGVVVLVQAESASTAGKARSSAFGLARASPHVLPDGAPGGRPLQTAVYIQPGQSEDLLFERVHDSGATVARLWLNWANVAPLQRPAGFQPANPGDPAYRWVAFDQQVSAAVQHGLQPLVTILQAPLWASGPGAGLRPGSVRPDPVELGRFARAAALRFNGSYGALPRVRYWQAWNEPNIVLGIYPQFENGQPFSPAWYRGMLNEFADAVHGVQSDNIVVSGGLAPFYDNSIAQTNWGPLSFMRELLCVGPDLKSTCSTRVSFDVWATHPYTSGGPMHHAVLPDDVSIGDLPEMRRILVAAYRLGHIAAPQRPPFWATEFSWDTNPPDPLGVPVELQVRWIADGLFRMWSAGVSLVTWLQLRDGPYPADYYQSGLYFRGLSGLAADSPKPGLSAFRFPFVSFPRRGMVFVWGRTPAGRQTQVVVEQSSNGSDWSRLGVVTTDPYGIFQASFRTSQSGSVRARTVDRGEQSPPFSLAPVPDQFFNPFGLPFLLEGRKP